MADCFHLQSAVTIFMYFPPFSLVVVSSTLVAKMKGLLCAFAVRVALCSTAVVLPEGIHGTRVYPKVSTPSSTDSRDVSISVFS